MRIVAQKLAKLQDANFRLKANNNNETSLFLSREMAVNIGVNDNTSCTFILNKTNLMQMLAYIFSLKIDLIYNKDSWHPSFFQFKEMLDSLDSFFSHREIAEYTITGVMQTQNRYYFKDLKKPVNINNSHPYFNIRDYLLEGYTNIIFLEKDDKKYIQLEVINSTVLQKESTSTEPLLDAYNKIFFGAPGTGKSFKLDSLCKKYFGNLYERVTFYPSYSFSQFVGTYKPIMISNNTADENSQQDISYSYVPGPFIRILEKAYKSYYYDHDDKNYLLIVEELNRANSAAVFGDMFQLLDRKNNGESRYPITISEDLKKHLDQEGIHLEDDKLVIPPNMYIWATMNSADQGVFPLDTAFKRRWDYEYFSALQQKDIDKCLIRFKDGTYYWGDIRKAINKRLAENNINEDKFIGPYFITESSFATDPTNEYENEKAVMAFKDKVIMYLFDDAARICRKDFFMVNGQYPVYSQIVEELDNTGLGILKLNIPKADEDISSILSNE